MRELMSMMGLPVPDTVAVLVLERVSVRDGQFAASREIIESWRVLIGPPRAPLEQLRDVHWFPSLWSRKEAEKAFTEWVLTERWAAFVPNPPCYLELET